MGEFRDFRWAIIASQQKNLRQVALALNIRQSTLSRRLRDLEHRLRAPLFERHKGGTRPTTAGRAFLESARRIVEETEPAFRRHKTQCAGESGRLTIGVYASLSTGNFVATLTEHQRRFPEVDVPMVDDGRERLLGDLAVNTIDIAIMAACGLGWDDLRLRLWSKRVIVAMTAAYPLSVRSVLRWP